MIDRMYIKDFSFKYTRTQVQGPVCNGKKWTISDEKLVENSKIFVFLDFGIVTCSNIEMLIKV